MDKERKMTTTEYNLKYTSPSLQYISINKCHSNSNCTTMMRYVPEPLLAGFDKPTFCHFWQLSKLPKLATSEAAKIGTFQSCQNWQLQKLPKVAISKAAKTGNFRSCQNWQLHKLPKLATS